MTIQFTEVQANLIKQAAEKGLAQFIKSCIMAKTIEAQAVQSQDTLCAIDGVLSGRTIGQAVGVQLDTIGDIVGQSRILIDQAEVGFFTTDDPLLGCDNAPVFVDGAPLFGDLIADDQTYRQLILSKVFKNHVKGGTMPEILNFVKIAYGVDISIRNIGNADLELTVLTTTPDFIVRAILSEVTDVRADHQFFLPLPTTARIVRVVYQPVVPFRADREGEGCDRGLCAGVGFL